MAKILYLVTEDWFFCRHFLPMAHAAKSAGLEVTVAARRSTAAAQIIADGFQFIEFRNDRGSLGPFEAVRSVARLASIVRAQKPDIVHCISLRMALLGGIAARIAGASTVILALTGLGGLWVRQEPAVRLARLITRLAIGYGLRWPGTHYLFENADDPGAFWMRSTDPDVSIVDGAGVDPLAFPCSGQPPAPPIKVAVIARMLEYKGIPEAVKATLLARSSGVPVELHLFGVPDPTNRLSVTHEALTGWTGSSGIHWHGHTTDSAAAYRDHHVAMLLSWGGEGLPRTLVEAAATGRPIITTDVAGCREVVRNGIEGFLVRPCDIESVALALSRLADDEDMRARMGMAARARFDERFTEEAVRGTMAQLYRRLVPSSDLSRN